MGRIRILPALATVGSILILTASAAQAVTTLPMRNTTVTIGNSGFTVTQWTVDGVNQYGGAPQANGLQSGSWFYRVGAGPIVSLDTVTSSVPVVNLNSGNSFDPSPSTINTVYQDVANGLKFTMAYQVTGGFPGSGSSTIDGQLTAQLIGSTTSAAVSIFEVNDLAVGGTEINDLVMPSLLEAARKVNQSDPTTVFGEGSTFKLAGSGASLLVSDPTHREAGLAGTVAADVAAGLLTDTPAAGVGITGNVGYAYEYSINLVAGTPSEIVELDVHRNLTRNVVVPGVVPEPISAMLSLIGLAALGVVAGRRSTKA